MRAEFSAEAIAGHVDLGPSGFEVLVQRAGRRLVKLVEPDVVVAGAQVRAPGLWAELIEQRPDEHLTVDLEAFALEVDEPDDEIGHRVPLGMELEWEVRTTEGGVHRCLVHGEVLVGDEAIELSGRGDWVRGSPRS